MAGVPVGRSGGSVVTTSQVREMIAQRIDAQAAQVQAKFDRGATAIAQVVAPAPAAPAQEEGSARPPPMPTPKAPLLHLQGASASAASNASAGPRRSSKASIPFFDEASEFQGARKGMVFKLGHLGLGYYLDATQTLLPEVQPLLPERWRDAALREERLQVDPRAGCGLSMEHSDFGFVIEGVEEKPGQALEAGEVIVAIEGRLLAGLSAPQMQASFAKRRVADARIHVASLAEVKDMAERDPAVLECWDPGHQRVYYFCKKTGRSGWTREELKQATGASSAASAPASQAPIDLASFLSHGFAKQKEQPKKKRKKEEGKPKDGKDESDLAREEKQRWDDWNAGGQGGYTEQFLDKYKNCTSFPTREKKEKRLKGSVGPGQGMEYMARWTGSKNSFN